MPTVPFREFPLFVDLYELAMAQSYFLHRPASYATFDLLVRKLPHHRSYLLFAGLADALDYLESLRFSKDDIDYLRSLKYFSRPFLDFLKKLRFRGDVFALREGEVFFANEPVLRITAPIIEAQIVESFLLNAVNFSTMIASKACRIVAAAGERGVFDFALRRTHGFDAALKAARSSYIAGFKGTSNVLAAKRYHLKAVGTMAHSFVMTFESELESFRAFSRTFPERSILLVDTYNSYRGIANAITVAKELKARGFSLRGIRLDSGDLIGLAKVGRRMLDRAGLPSVRIFASGNLDEYKIENIVKARAPIDDFGVGTNMGTSCDAPYLDVIYKISEVTDAAGRFLPTMKLSYRKVSYPGRKQVYRFKERGVFKNDLIALEEEPVKGARPLLEQVMKKGRRMHASFALPEIQSRARHNISLLPQQYTHLGTPHNYPVLISRGLMKTVQKLSQALQKRSEKADFLT